MSQRNSTFIVKSALNKDNFPYIKHGSLSFSKEEATIIIQKIEGGKRGRIRRSTRELKKKGII